MNINPHLAFVGCPERKVRWLERQLTCHGVSYRKGTGCYEGECETSYCIILSTDIRMAEKRLNYILDLAKSMDQEAVLYVDNERTAYMVYLDKPDAPRIGKFEPVAYPTGDYSLFNGKYYEVRDKE